MGRLDWTMVDRIKFENIPNNTNHKVMLAWLETNIEPANKRDKDGNTMPYYVNVISQYAQYAGETNLWHLEVRGSSLKKIVEIADPKLAVRFALECTYAK